MVNTMRITLAGEASIAAMDSFFDKSEDKIFRLRKNLRHQ